MSDDVEGIDIPPATKRYLVRTAGAESNIVHTVEADSYGVTASVVIFYRADAIVYVAGLARLVDIRPE